ncbi:MAG: histidine phosphatase family protein [Mucilaginibacter sp.]|nr:histidine phosphatase family protein [Mucilaginibacter sp.]
MFSLIDMKINYLAYVILLLLTFGHGCANAQHKGLKLVFIRHAEKSDDGDNLNCKGLNRSMLLPGILIKKFGKPDNIYIPSVKSGEPTKHLRMLQTVTPLAIKYDLRLNSAYDVNDSKGIGNALLHERRTILIVWEHQAIVPILEYIGINTDRLLWQDDDFDTIWIVTFSKGKAILTPDKEMLNPLPGCPF